MKLLFPLVGMLLVLSCTMVKETNTIGSIQKMDDELDNVISTGASIEVLGKGYSWSEGPVWVAAENMLLFSDVPNNVIFKWTEASGVEEYLKPSGYTGETPSASKEPGSNGLTIHNDTLLLCQHGDRRVARMMASFNSPEPIFETVAGDYQGKRFNSPNDLVARSNGDVFFTDPPYGLPEQEKDPSRELSYQGVFKVSEGKVTLLVDSLTRPNGIAFFPGEKEFIVANSDPDKAAWFLFKLDDQDSIVQSSVFYDATADTKTLKGLPDGLKITQKGYVLATGPGGVWVFNRTGKALGKIALEMPAANCALSADEKTIYITADDHLLRVKLRD